MSILNNFHTQQIDFFLAYPQQEVECEMNMDVPRGLEHVRRRKTNALKPIKNINGTRHSGRIWNLHIHEGQLQHEYVQSTVDHCVKYHGKTILLLFDDDDVFAGPDANEIKALIMSLRSNPACATQDDYVRVKIQQTVDKHFTLMQLHLIQHILDNLGFKNNQNQEDSCPCFCNFAAGHPWEHTPGNVVVPISS
jgi:hypothetical protein